MRDAVEAGKPSSGDNVAIGLQAEGLNAIVRPRPWIKAVVVVPTDVQSGDAGTTGAADARE